jgi:hypothetical protein
MTDAEEYDAALADYTRAAKRMLSALVGLGALDDFSLRLKAMRWCFEELRDSLARKAIHAEPIPDEDAGVQLPAAVAGGRPGNERNGGMGDSGEDGPEF